MDSECVDIGIVGRLVGCCHEVYGIAGTCEEEKLESSVVGAVCEGPEKIEVACHIDDEVERLRLE